jgi:ABC-type uncharacterized transport system substrate-binding protein
VIIAADTEAALAAKAATIPIVFFTGGDPVALGLVASLNRPGANLTGSASLAGELAPKQLQLLRELTPDAARFGVLADPAFPGIRSIITDLEVAVRTLGLQLAANTFRRSLVLLASRSRRMTSRTSPLSRAARTRASAALSVLAPLCFSLNTFSAPAALRAAT